MFGLGLLNPAPSVASPAAPTPISSCKTTISTPGNYKLIGNLTASGATCITITVNNVSIDLGGHTISGNASSSTSMFGITDGGNNLNTIAIVNGTIAGFNVNIELNDTKGVTIDHVKVTNAVTSSTAGDGGDGIDALDCRNTVSNSKATGNGGDGIDATKCCNGVSTSTANDNKGNGIVVGGTANQVVNCSASGNVSGDGVYASSPNGSNTWNQVTNGKFAKNGKDGVELNPGGTMTATPATSNGRTAFRSCARPTLCW